MTSYNRMKEGDELQKVESPWSRVYFKYDL